MCLGFVSFELPISDKPVLGEWQLTASAEGFATDVVATFEVDEYVLPKFEVVIDVPPTISESEAARGVAGQINAVYTYGERVSGSAKLELWKEADLYPQSFGPPWGAYFGPFQEDEEEGVLESQDPPKPVATLDVFLENNKATAFAFNLVNNVDSNDSSSSPPPPFPNDLDSKELPVMIMDCFRCNVQPWMQNSWGQKLVVKAVVTEGPTGAKQDAEISITTAKHPFNHKFTVDRDFFIRGLPFAGSLTVTKLDGSPAITDIRSDTLLKPKVTVLFCYLYSPGCKASSVVEVPCTLQGGVCDFSVTVPFDATTVVFDVVEPVGNFPDSSGKQTYTVQGSNAESASSSYLRIFRDQKEAPTVHVGSSMRIVAAATAPFTTIQWKAVANGKLVAFGAESDLTPTCTQSPSRDNRCKCLRYTKKEIKILETSWLQQIECGEAPDFRSRCRVAEDSTCPHIESQYIGWDQEARESLYVPASGAPCGIYDGQACLSEFTIDVTAEMAGANAKLFAFFITEDGEIVPDEIDLGIARDLSTKVTIDLANEKEYYAPGEDVTITVKSEGTVVNDVQDDTSVESSSSAGTSLLGLAAIDKSVLLLRNEKALTAVDVLTDQANALSADKLYNRNLFAADTFGKAGLAFLHSNNVSVPQQQRWIWGGGGVRVDDVVMVAAPEMDAADGFPPPPAAAPPPPPGGGAPLKKVAKVRSYFPETWIYESQTIINGEPHSFTFKAPDTITSWMFSGVCVSSETGLGISKTNAIKIFRPFFLEMKLPYSVVRGESFELVVAVYMYDNPVSEDEAAAEDVTVTLDRTNGVTSDYEMIGANQKICAGLRSGQPCSVSFYLKPARIGNIKLAVKAQTTTQADASERVLIVKPEGVEREYTTSRLMVIDEGTGVSNVLDLKTAVPTDTGLVPESASIRVSATADLMGASIEGLDQLVRLPTGCGEQNMITFSPIISVRKYLVATGGLTSKLEADTDKYMTTGYQRELTYRRRDNGFSAFGDSDPESSMWLSAFVLRSFALADTYVYIDPQILSTTAAWIISLQKETGIFPTYGRVIHADMKGGAAGSELTLTAYVTLALLECREALDALNADHDHGKDLNDGIAKAVEYIEGNYTNSAVSVYSSTLAAFVLTKAKSPHAEDARKIMMGKASDGPNGRYWNTSPNGKDQHSTDKENGVPPWQCHSQRSQDVEATAYALLVMVAAGDFASGVNVAKWLAQSRNGNGGWQSTQDTVVALEALSEYAAKTMEKMGSIAVTVTASSTEAHVAYQETLQLTGDNFGLFQTVAIPTSNVKDGIPSSVSFVAHGTGGKCMVSSTVSWFEAEPTLIAPPIILVVKQFPGVFRRRRRDHDTDAAAAAPLNPVYTMKVCASIAHGRNAAGMSVIQADFFSGFVLGEAVGAIQANNPGVKLVENYGTGIAFYIDEITADRTCVKFEATRAHRVGEVKPIRVRAYDYYELETSVDMLVVADPTINVDVADDVDAVKCRMITAAKLCRAESKHSSCFWDRKDKVCIRSEVSNEDEVPIKCNDFSKRNECKTKDSCTWKARKKQCTEEDASPACQSVSKRNACKETDGCQWKAQKKQCIMGEAAPTCESIPKRNACKETEGCKWRAQKKQCTVA